MRLFGTPSLPTRRSRDRYELGVIFPPALQGQQELVFYGEGILPAPLASTVEVRSEDIDHCGKSATVNTASAFELTRGQLNEVFVEHQTQPKIH